jgi:hypothetical protein
LLTVLVLVVLAPQVVAKRVQVFGFSPEKKLPTFKGYDWSLLTTSAWRTDPELIELAQQHGAKVEIFADIKPIMGDPEKRKKWVSKSVAASST